MTLSATERERIQRTAIEQARANRDTAEHCDECGHAIPATEPDMVNLYHARSCSLHPSAVESAQ